MLADPGGGSSPTTRNKANAALKRQVARVASTGAPAPVGTTSTPSSSRSFMPPPVKGSAPRISLTSPNPSMPRIQPVSSQVSTATPRTFAPVPIKPVQTRFLHGLKDLQVPVPTSYSDIANDYGDTGVSIRSSPHEGVDISRATGTPVRAAANGVIEEVNPDTGGPYGNQILVRHGGNRETMYGHLNGFASIEPGTRVEKGDIIGYVGTTGNSTGPHLHWETRINGQAVNPDMFVTSGPNGEAVARLHSNSPYEAPSPHENSNPDKHVQGGPKQASGDDPVHLPGASLGNEQAGSANVNTHKNSELQAFLMGIADQESGGNYSAVGVQTKYGTALGKYQILDSNITGNKSGWDYEALGRDIQVQQFMNSPQLQETIARTKLSQYFKQYGAAGAAKAWYGGPGNADSMSDSPQYGGPSLVDYASSVLNHMSDHLGKNATASSVPKNSPKNYAPQTVPSSGGYSSSGGSSSSSAPVNYAAGEGGKVPGLPSFATGSSSAPMTGSAIQAVISRAAQMGATTGTDLSQFFSDPTMTGDTAVGTPDPNATPVVSQTVPVSGKSSYLTKFLSNAQKYL